jgi:hypothetical protein
MLSNVKHFLFIERETPEKSGQALRYAQGDSLSGQPPCFVAE